MVAALATELALRRQDLVAGRVFRRFEDAHLLQREAALVEKDQMGPKSCGVFLYGASAPAASAAPGASSSISINQRSSIAMDIT